VHDASIIFIFEKPLYPAQNWKLCKTHLFPCTSIAFLKIFDRITSLVVASCKQILECKQEEFTIYELGSYNRQDIYNLRVCFDRYLVTYYQGRLQVFVYIIIFSVSWFRKKSTQYFVQLGTLILLEGASSYRIYVRIKPLF